MQVGMFFYVFSLSYASSSREDYTKSSSFGVLWGFVQIFILFKSFINQSQLIKKKRKKKSTLMTWRWYLLISGQVSSGTAELAIFIMIMAEEL